MVYEPTIQTIILIGLFLLVYTGILLKSAIKYKIDLIDFILLIAVAIIPSLFVFVPKLVIFIIQVFGVGFGFEVLYGVLFFIAFIYFFRIVVILLNHKTAIIKLTQEI